MSRGWAIGSKGFRQAAAIDERNQRAIIELTQAEAREARQAQWEAVLERCMKQLRIEESGIECLPHNSPLATAVLGLAAGAQTQVTLPAGPAVLTVLSIRNPTQAELDRLLTTIKPPESEEEE